MRILSISRGNSKRPARAGRGGALFVALALSACSAALPPAVPEEQTVFEAPAVVETPPPPAPVPPPVEVPAVSLQPVVTPTPQELQAVGTRPPRTSRPSRTEHPETVVTAANTGSRMAPTKQGYAEGQSGVQRYPYLPGKVYDIYSSPNHPTTIILPPGERLAAPPTLNPEQWQVGVAEMEGEGLRQEALIIRPLAAGQEATTPLLTQSGRAFFCHLRSFERTSMVAVTWDIPRLTMPGIDGMAARTDAVKRAAEAPSRQDPQVDLTRLHTAYAIEKASGNPPWVPLAVYDDGNKTFIRFKEPLTYTAAPAVFVRHADGAAGVVQFSPYTVPNAPEKGAYYIVQGLWPQLELKGGDDQVVRITRLTGQAKPYKAGYETR